MTAKIIQLGDYRKSVIRCDVSSVVFPQLYRRSGMTWKFSDSAETAFEPGDEPFVIYTLSPEDDDTIANSKFEAITHLDITKDKGWVIVRHHLSMESADGYLDASSDLGDPLRAGQMLFQTSTGVFTIVHRPPAQNRPDCLVAYLTKIHGDLGMEDWAKIIDSNGHEQHIDFLLPPEEE